MLIQSLTRSGSTKVVTILGGANFDNSELVAKALPYAGETEYSLFGSSVKRFDCGTVEVHLYTD